MKTKFKVVGLLSGDIEKVFNIHANDVGELLEELNKRNVVSYKPIKFGRVNFSDDTPFEPVKGDNND